MCNQLSATITSPLITVDSWSKAMPKESRGSICTSGLNSSPVVVAYEAISAPSLKGPGLMVSVPGKWGALGKSEKVLTAMSAICGNPVFVHVGEFV